MATLEIEAIKHSKKVYEGVIKPTPFIDGMCHGGKRGFIEGAEWMKEKAVEAYKNTCRFSPIGCCMIKKEAGKCDCDELKEFIESF